MATAVFYFFGVVSLASTVMNGTWLLSTYKPQRNDADNVHEDMPAITEDDCVQRHKRLFTAEREECIGVGLTHSEVSVMPQKPLR